MKILVYFLGFIFIIIFSVGCEASRSDEQLLRIESQLQAINSSLNSVQQEMASLRRAITDSQEQNRVLQQQVLDTIKNSNTICANRAQPVSSIYVVPTSYSRPYPYYRPFPPYPFPPHPFPPFPPFH